MIRKKINAILRQLGGISLFLAISFLVHAQEKSVTGSVKDEVDSSMLNMSVMVKGTLLDVSTNVDGKHFTCFISKKEQTQSNLIL